MADIAAVLATLRAEIGKPYVWGASGPSSFDCSGLVQYVFGQHGVSLPRTSAEQAKVGVSIPKGQQAPGDLVFSDWEGRGAVSHVAVYVGDGQVIEAPSTGQKVKVTPLSANYLNHVKNIQRVGGGTGGGLGLSGTSTATASIGNPLDGVAAALSGIGETFGSISTLATSVNRLALPQWWVRILAGFAGTALVFLGLWRLTKEVKD